MKKTQEILISQETLVDQTVSTNLHVEKEIKPKKFNKGVKGLKKPNMKQGEKTTNHSKTSFIQDTGNTNPSPWSVHSDFVVGNQTEKRDFQDQVDLRFVKSRKPFIFTMVHSDIQKVSQFFMSTQYQETHIGVTFLVEAKKSGTNFSSNSLTSRKNLTTQTIHDFLDQKLLSQAKRGWIGTQAFL